MFPPPGTGLYTVILYIPGAAISDEKIVAVMLVSFTKLVTLFDPLNRTTDEALKFEPFTASIKVPPPVLIHPGEMVVEDGTGLFTMNELLVPVCELPVLVAVTVNVPPGEIVTLLDESIPATNAGVVPLPEDKVPDDVMSVVPVNKLTPVLHVLFSASLAVTIILKDVPAI